MEQYNQSVLVDGDSGQILTEEAVDELQKIAAEERKRLNAEHPENRNLVDQLDKDEADRFAANCIKEYEEDKESRSGWEDLHKRWVELYYQIDKPVANLDNRNWGSKSSIPILTEACNQFQARSRQVFFPNKSFVSAVPTTNKFSKDLDQRADRIGKHLSYQLTYVDKNYKRDKDALFLAVALHGSHFTKTYYDASIGRFKVDNVRATDLIIPYNVGPISIEDLPRKTHVIYQDKLKAKNLFDRKFYAVEPKPSQPEITGVDQAVQEGEGLEPNAFENNICTILEQHRFMELEGEYIPVIAMVCAGSRKLLRLTVRYETDEDGNPLREKKPIEYFTHYKFLENPDGFYGFGLGHLVGDLNEAVNVGIRQMIDAATLANDGNMSGFISNRLSVDGKEVELSLGQFIPVPDNVTNLSDGIYQMKFPGPSAQLGELIQFLDNRAQRIASTTDALTGDLDKIRQPTTILTEVEQGLQVFTSVQMRLADSMGDELSKIFRINQRFLPSSDYFIVNNVPQEITRKDYQDDYRIEPLFDPRFATQTQKLARAQAEINAVLQNPNSQTRPEVYDAAFRRYLETIEVDNIDELVPPPQEKKVERIDDQQVENMYFLMPNKPDFDVHPEQDHQIHLAQIDEFMQSAYGQELTKEAAAELLQHRQKHIAFLYAKQMGILDETEQAGVEGLGESGYDAMGFGGVNADVPPNTPLGSAEIVGEPQLIGGSTTGAENPE
jgi:chaperonin GroES